MEWKRYEMFTQKTGDRIQFTESFLLGSVRRRVVWREKEPHQSWLACEDGGVSTYSERLVIAEPVIHRPPVPAPCEHTHYCTCSPPPAPDSVEAARRVVEGKTSEQHWRLDVLALRDFLLAYASEQTAQRKAAGELAERCVQYNSTGSYQLSPYDVVAGALWGYARCRAGKDGGK